MFVYSIKASSLKFFGVLILSVALLVGFIAFIPTYDERAVSISSTSQDDKISYNKIKTNEDRINFLAHFGWCVEETPSEEIVCIPGEFDKVFTEYNNLQKMQGLNLEKYKNREVTRYTYVITNYEGYNGKVYANILVYKNKIVGGDVCSADPNGFLHGFDKNVTR